MHRVSLVVIDFKALIEVIKISTHVAMHTFPAKEKYIYIDCIQTLHNTVFFFFQPLIRDTHEG